MLTKSKVIDLLCKVDRLERNATSPRLRKYWARHWDRLHQLARQVGWID